MTSIISTPTTRKELSHDRIVEVASRAIRRAGFRGVGVADLMKEAGLTHGGFYAHFESRDALVLEALQRAGRDNLAALTTAVQRRLRKGGTRWAALVAVYLHEHHIDHVEDGCVVAALASEVARQSEPVREEARRRVIALVDLVHAALPEGAERAEAELAAATMVGALQLARSLGGRAGRELLARTRQTLIQRHDPASSR